MTGLAAIPAADLSMAERVALMPEDERLDFLASMSPEAAEELRWTWEFWGRPDQFAPPEPWSIFVLSSGRGAGKGRAGAELVRKLARERPTEQGVFVAATPGDARDYMIGGPSGIQTVSPEYERPEYEPSKRLLTWPNGARALIRTGADEDDLRGFEGGWAWVDEMCKFRYMADVWSNLRLGLRAGDDPKTIITTTPRPWPLWKEIVSGKWPGTVVRRVSTMRNRANLSAAFLAEVTSMYGGTRLGAQELLGEIVEDTEGALWSMQLIERGGRAFLEDILPTLRRIVVAVDPSWGTQHDECGIIVAGVDDRSQGYLLDDRSGRMSPKAWGDEVANAYRSWNADRVIVEGNYQTEQVKLVLSAIDDHLPVKMVHARMGKRLRAEPVVALYEQGRIRHAGTFADLERQMTGWVEGDGTSPDRIDALVYAFTDLMLGAGARRATVATGAGLRI